MHTTKFDTTDIYTSGATGLGSYRWGTGLGFAIPPQVLLYTAQIAGSLLGNSTRFSSPDANLQERMRRIDEQLALALSGNSAGLQQLIVWTGFYPGQGIATPEAKTYAKAAVITFYQQTGLDVPSDLAAFLGVSPGIQRELFPGAGIPPYRGAPSTDDGGGVDLASLLSDPMTLAVAAGVGILIASSMSGSKRGSKRSRARRR